MSRDTCTHVIVSAIMEVNICFEICSLRKKLTKCYIWSMALYGAETWTLRAADQK